MTECTFCSMYFYAYESLEQMTGVTNILPMSHCLTQYAAWAFQGVVLTLRGTSKVTCHGIVTQTGSSCGRYVLLTSWAH